MEGASQPPNVAFHVPSELETGSYANMLGVWHSPHEFTLDFAVTMPIVPVDPGEPQTVPCEVVARLKVAPSLVFDLLQALNANMAEYEQAYGEIHRPAQRRSQDDDG
jgi:Protein of unknown function (DUF3467)